MGDITHFYSDRHNVAICGAAASFGIGTAAKEFVTCETCKEMLFPAQNPLLAAAESHLQVLADQLDERGDQRGPTVRAFGRNLLAMVEEFEKLQRLEVVAGDLIRQYDDPIATTGSLLLAVRERLKPFFTSQIRTSPPA